MALRIERLATHHQRGGFDCGDADLNQFLSQQVGQLARKNFCKTYVAVDDGSVAVMGFVSVSVGQAQTAQLSHQLKLPRYPEPILCIGRSAVDKTQQGQGIGQHLMSFALRMALEFSQKVGLYAVVVDAKNQTGPHVPPLRVAHCPPRGRVSPRGCPAGKPASAFYTALGFTATLDDPLCMYLPVATLQKVMQES